MSLREALRGWRVKQAQLEGVEVFRVVPNTTLESIVSAQPQTKEELMAIKGIKDAKYRKYGKDILALVTMHMAPIQSVETTEKKDISEQIFKEEKPLSVSQFLDGLNIELSGMAARVKGEVSSVDERERVVYFTVKDSEDGSTLNCLIFRYQYQLSGVSLAIGDEIIVEGAPDIYKPSGRLSLKVGLIELAGEGALKKAYDALSKKLEQEGLLAPERKRVLPVFPSRIALITSEQGAAIGDFTMNLGQLGIKVDFYPASVEGMRAVVDILEALRYFAKHADRYDLLVMIRGGGSLESLQAFNNETLIREVAVCPLPTLLGIGHEKDVTLAALVADIMVSTPTATARTLREPFERARQMVDYSTNILMSRGESTISEQRMRIGRAEQSLSFVFPKITERFSRVEQNLLRSLDRIAFILSTAKEQYREAERIIFQGYTQRHTTFTRSILHVEEKLREYDPHRALLLGYSLVRSGQRLIRSVADVKRGAHLSIQVRDGTIETEVQ